MKQVLRYGATTAALLAAVLLLHPWVTDVGQRVLVVVGAWLAIETMLLREGSWKQLEQGFASERNAASPYIFQEMVTQGENTLRAVIVKNVSDKLALNLLAFRYDGQQKNYQRSRMVANYLAPSSEREMGLEENRHDMAGFLLSAKEMLDALDPQILEQLVNSAKATARHCDLIGVIYSDNLGNYYLIMRAADVTVSPVTYRAVPWAGKRSLLSQFSTK